MPFVLIALVSAAALFLEMLLVRWVAAEVRVFAYMHNLVLVACFLGFGLGCASARAEPRWERGLLALGVVALIVTDPLRLGVGDLVTRGIAAAEGTVVWGVGEEPPGGATIALALGLTLAIFALCALAIEPFGQSLGARIDAHERPLAAYGANLIGSLAGIWGFFGLAALSTGPSEWFGATAALTVPLLVLASTGRRRVLAARLALLALPLGIVAVEETRSSSGRVLTLWSPYQKLQVTPVHLPARPGAAGPELAGFHVLINNTTYQLALNLSRAHRAAHPEAYAGCDLGLYDLPFRVLGPPRRVLVVGAGTGNDVAAALRGGAGRVDAVEIDPEIARLGAQLHPEHPYRSPRVRTYIDDARAFFRSASPGSYDVIWFGLLDSHTTASGYTNLRLDHYVYTRESLAAARRLLAPGGVIVCAFASQRTWIGDRIHGLLRDAFDGSEPLSMWIPDSRYCGLTSELFFGGPRESMSRVRAAFAADGRLDAFVRARASRHEGTTQPTTDDWPYLYLREPGVPMAHLWVTLAIAAVAAVRLAFRRWRGGRETVRGPPSFFFLGAAFLLLEVVGVSRAALLFGSTWAVAAVVVSGVLVMAMLGTGWVALSRSRSIAWPSVGLGAAGAALLLVPLDAFAALPPLARGAAAAAFLAAPLLFSGILFARLFVQTERKDLALGANLLGAMLGGLCEILSFATGLRALTWVALVFYALAVACAAWERRRPARSAPR